MTRQRNKHLEESHEGQVPEDGLKNAAEKRQVLLLKCLSIAAGAAMLAYLILSSFDTTTELIPDHESISDACLILGGLGAAVAAAIALAQWKKLAIARSALCGRRRSLFWAV